MASWIQLSWIDRSQGERARDISRALRETKVDQLRDNRSRHQFRERVVTILSWNPAAKKRTGHICTIPRIGIQAWVLGMHPPGDKVPSTVGSHPVRGGMRRMTIVET